MRYAKALMEYAKSMGAEDTLYKEFCMLDRAPPPTPPPTPHTPTPPANIQRALAIMRIALNDYLIILIIVLYSSVIR